MVTWSEFKARLAHSVEWFKGFDRPFSELLNEAIAKNKIERMEYDPLLIEATLKDVSSLLDRALTYRRDAQDLEISAARAAADYAKFTELVPTHREAEILAHGLDRLKAEKAAAVKAATAFKEATSGSGLEKGFTEVESGKVSAAEKQISIAERQIVLSKTKWDITSRFEEEAQARHTASGSSHNYKDRMDRLLRFLAEDLQEAFFKAAALFDGVDSVYGRRFVLPELSSDTAIDDMVSVVRAAARWLEQESLKFSSFDAVIPLCQPIYMIGGECKPLVEFKTLRDAIASGSWLEFELTPAFAGLTSIRLRGVGISFGNELWGQLDPGRLPEMSAYRLTADLVAPRQPIADREVRRPTIHFGNVSVYSGSSSLAWNSGNGCYNASPVGKWRIRLSSNAVHSLRDAKLSADYVEDLKVHISAVGIVTANT